MNRVVMIGVALLSVLAVAGAVYWFLQQQLHKTAKQPLPSAPTIDVAAEQKVDLGADRYSVDWQGVTENFPPEFAPPPLLKAFSLWLAEQRWGSQGYFQVEGGRLDDWWIENGSDLAEQLPQFIRLPEGSTIGYWRRPSGEAPVVLIGSEGELDILADDTAEYLNLLVRDTSNDPSDTNGEAVEPDNPKAGRPAFRAWLVAQGAWLSDEVMAQRAKARDARWVAQLAALKRGARNPTHTSDEVRAENPLAHYLLVERRPQVIALDADPAVLALGRIFQSFRPPSSADAWEQENVDIAWVGERLVISRFQARQSVPISPAQLALAKPHLAALREASRRANPGRGLWQAANLRLYPKRTQLIREYSARPNPRLFNFTPEECLDDLLKQGRTHYWRAGLEKILRGVAHE